MRGKGRFERYVATNDCSGEFTITGTDQAQVGTSGKAPLKVCKNCLRELNYDGYRHERHGAFARFDLQRFFETYSSYFPHMPMRMPGEQDGGYAPDWAEVSRRRRENANHTCEDCGVRLGQHPGLLHVHHVNGVVARRAESLQVRREVGYPIETGGRTIALVELAWPAQRRGVAISADDIHAAEGAGWRVLDARQALEQTAPLHTPPGQAHRSGRRP